jgi:hypothetical protein
MVVNCRFKIFNPSNQDHDFFAFQLFYQQNRAVIDGAFTDIEKGAEAEMDHSVSCKKIGLQC